MPTARAPEDGRHGDDGPAPYYYAQGQRVWLHPAPQARACWLPGPPEPGPPPAQWRRLQAQLWWWEGPGETPAPLPGWPLPVFEEAGQWLVALPQVRVEDDADAALQRVHGWLAQASASARLEGAAPGRLTLVPGPALGYDSVALARWLVETCGVRSASPRLLRVAPSPPPRDTRR